MQGLFDRQLAIARKLRSLRLPRAGSDFLVRRAAEDLADRLSVIERRFRDAATIFCNGDEAAAVLRDSGKVEIITRIEADAALLGSESGIVEADEIVPLQPQSIDLVVSLFGLDAINDVPGMMIQIRRALRPDGLFLGAFAGAGTLAELRESLLAAETEITGGAAVRVHPFLDVRDAGALLQRAGFALPVADLETVRARYSSAFGLMRDLRAMGATSLLADRPRQPLRRSVLDRASQIHNDRHADADGRIRATFNIVWVSGWAPHGTQQQPLKPGSAKARLGDALRSFEKRRD